MITHLLFAKKDGLSLPQIMILSAITKSQHNHELLLFMRMKPFEVIFTQLADGCVLLHQISVSCLAFSQIPLQVIQILSKFNSIIDLDSQLYLLEVSIGDHNLPEYTWRHHPNESLHLIEIRVKGVRHNVIDLVWRLMIEHEKISINAYKTTSEGTFLCLLHYLCSIFFTYEMNEALIRISGKEVSSEICKFNLCFLLFSNNSQGLKMLANLHKDSVFSKGSHRNIDQFLISVFLYNSNHLIHNEGLCLELKSFVTVSIVEYHLIYFYRNTTHPLHFIFLFLILSQAWGKQNWVFFHHRVFVSEIASKENSAHVSTKENHGCSRYMFRIEQCKFYLYLFFDKSD